MRPLVIGAVTLIALAAVAVALARLGGTVGQLRALDVAAPIPPTPPPTSAPMPVPMPAPGSATGVEPPEDVAADREVARAASGDEHIARWLAQDPEFARAAEELLQDPNPAVQIEARELLRELGAEPEASAER